MKLLFANAVINGSTELKSLLGFIDADIKFDKIKPDVITATNELIKLIGSPVYESVLTKYTEGSTDENDLHLIYLTRYPIAIRAYSFLAPSNDIAHTTNGRKMRQDENQKQAFEWMLDRDNTALEKRYYRALDDLLQYLDEHSNVWKESEAYKKSHKLFIRTTTDFDEYFRIDSRLILLMLEPGLRQCEQNEILPRTGKIRFDALKSVLVNNDSVEDETELQLLSLIKEACAYYALAWSMMRLSVHIFPEGVLQAYTSDRMTTQGKMPAAKMETEAARQAFAADAKLILDKIEMLLEPAPNINTVYCNKSDIITGTNFIST